MKTFRKTHIRTQDILLVTLSIMASIVMLLIPTGFETPEGTSHSMQVRATILEVDNSQVREFGPVIEGTQHIELRIDSGTFKGEVMESINSIIGKKELDKVFEPGDKAYVVLDLDESEDTIVYANVIDHYRSAKTLILLLLFFVTLFAVAGWIGLKSIISFIFTGIILLKVLLPLFLHGYNPIITAAIVVTILTGGIIFLVGGISRKGLTAFSGSFAGVLATVLLAIISTHWFELNGATSPFLESLLYAGFGSINLTQIFIAGIFIASSGAVMDLAMDISASMHEVLEKHPAITRFELMTSGLTVGRHAVGTMTTTLLLAYSGGYTGMLMNFIGRGVPFENVINMVFVSSELIHTFVGSFGLVLVAPLTALAGSLIYIPRRAEQQEEEESLLREAE
ncbi:MAG: YibE/F family protein [Sphaerochaetaceae bacterium]|nr:YibE/F family protein [Sphaerochaetaceae bacterium]